jgi:hypothetical protein
MHSSLFSKPDLLKTFTPLSDGGKAYLEILLVNAKTNKAEGRGFFNDPDFLLEACRGLVGRFNFCLSNFAYNQAQIPTRAAYNQFDRSLADFPGQDQARAHSFSFCLLFKPELIREMTAPGQHPAGPVNFVNEIESILSRFGAKRYGLDYFLTGVAVRICAPIAMQKRPLSKPGLTLATKKMLEILDKQMTPLDRKHFGLTSSVTGKIFDPAPGLPGIFVPDAPDSMVVTSSGDLAPGDEAAIGALLEEAFETKRGSKADRPKAEGYATPLNIQGLSQSWSETSEPQYESAAGAELEHHRPGPDAEQNGHAEPPPREDLRELETWFHDYVRGKCAGRCIRPPSTRSIRARVAANCSCCVAIRSRASRPSNSCCKARRPSPRRARAKCWSSPSAAPWANSPCLRFRAITGPIPWPASRRAAYPTRTPWPGPSTPCSRTLRN